MNTVTRTLWFTHAKARSLGPPHVVWIDGDSHMIMANRDAWVDAWVQIFRVLGIAAGKDPETTMRMRAFRVDGLPHQLTVYCPHVLTPLQFADYDMHAKLERYAHRLMRIANTDHMYDVATMTTHIAQQVARVCDAILANNHFPEALVLAVLAKASVTPPDTSQIQDDDNVDALFKKFLQSLPVINASVHDTRALALRFARFLAEHNLVRNDVKLNIEINEGGDVTVDETPVVASSSTATSTSPPPPLFPAAATPPKKSPPSPPPPPIPKAPSPPAHKAADGPPLPKPIPLAPKPPSPVPDTITKESQKSDGVPPPKTAAPPPPLMPQTLPKGLTFGGANVAAFPLNATAKTKFLNSGSTWSAFGGSKPTHVWDVTTVTRFIPKPDRLSNEITQYRIVHDDGVISIPSYGALLDIFPMLAPAIVDAMQSSPALQQQPAPPPPPPPPGGGGGRPPPPPPPSAAHSSSVSSTSFVFGAQTDGDFDASAAPQLRVDVECKDAQTLALSIAHKKLWTDSKFLTNSNLIISIHLPKGIWTDHFVRMCKTYNEDVDGTWTPWSIRAIMPLTATKGLDECKRQIASTDIHESVISGVSERDRILFQQAYRILKYACGSQDAKIVATQAFMDTSNKYTIRSWSDRQAICDTYMSLLASPSGGAISLLQQQQQQETRTTRPNIQNEASFQTWFTSVSKTAFPVTTTAETTTTTAANKPITQQSATAFLRDAVDTWTTQHLQGMDKKQRDRIELPLAKLIGYIKTVSIDTTKRFIAAAPGDTTLDLNALDISDTDSIDLLAKGLTEVLPAHLAASDNTKRSVVVVPAELFISVVYAAHKSMLNDAFRTFMEEAATDAQDILELQMTSISDEDIVKVRSYGVSAINIAAANIKAAATPDDTSTTFWSHLFPLIAIRAMFVLMYRVTSKVCDNVIGIGGLDTKLMDIIQAYNNPDAHGNSFTVLSDQYFSMLMDRMTIPAQNTALQYCQTGLFVGAWKFALESVAPAYWKKILAPPGELEKLDPADAQTLGRSYVRRGQQIQRINKAYSISQKLLASLTKYKNKSSASGTASEVVDRLIDELNSKQIYNAAVATIALIEGKKTLTTMFTS